MNVTMLNNYMLNIYRDIFNFVAQYQIHSFVCVHMYLATI